MGSITDKLQALLNNKQTLVNNVNQKAGTSYTVTSKLSDIANSVLDISGDGESTLKKLLDATKSTAYMFYRNTTLADLTGFIEYSDTENVENMQNMFYGCTSLSKSIINLQSATNISCMYSGCANLKLLEIYNYNISNASNANQFASNCYSLKAVVFRSFGNNYIAGQSMFLLCYRILGVQHDTYNIDGVRDGYIYMPRDMIDIVKKTNPWDSYINGGIQVRALEDYTLDGTTTGELDLAKMGLE